ncbi:hypothetical protein [Streptomyces sp. NPDC088348]|uniref:hypothetical protein n=1 Tax=Streptomyces sp. NPDC088348 TaxID=3365853 RepID=UPI003821BCB0
MTTPTPAPAAAADVDQALTLRCTSSGQFLAGIMAAGMLDTLARPTQLPADLFPDVDQAVVTAIWNRALTVGYRAGQMVAQPRWTPENLHRLKDALAEVGYVHMGALADRSANTLRAGEHPADVEAGRVRGEHW